MVRGAVEAFCRTPQKTMREHRSQMSRVVTWKERPANGTFWTRRLQNAPANFRLRNARARPEPLLRREAQAPYEWRGYLTSPPPNHIRIFILFFYPLLYLCRKYLTEIILGVRNHHCARNKYTWLWLNPCTGICRWETIGYWFCFSFRLKMHSIICKWKKCCVLERLFFILLSIESIK